MILVKDAVRATHHLGLEEPYHGVGMIKYRKIVRYAKLRIKTFLSALSDRKLVFSQTCVFMAAYTVTSAGRQSSKNTRRHWKLTENK